MSSNKTNSKVYAAKVELLLRLMPVIMDEGVFAVQWVTGTGSLTLKNITVVN